MKKREEWTGKLAEKMFVNRVTRKDIAQELGCTEQYITLILNGQRGQDRVRAAEKLDAAVDLVIAKRRAAEAYGEAVSSKVCIVTSVSAATQLANNIRPLSYMSWVKVMVSFGP